MPARVVTDLTDAQRQVMRKYNARYVYRFGEHGDGEMGSETQHLVTQNLVGVSSGKRGKYIHWMTAFIVFVFVVATGVMWGQTPLTSADLTYSIYVFERPGGAGVQAVQALANYVEGPFCSSATLKTATLALYNNNALPVQLATSTSLSVWGMLMAVLLITMLFELYRTGVLTSFLPTDLKYSPQAGPDLSRWLEYALTSPWQVIIVAISFHIREAPLLLALGMLQALLVLIGYPIEREIDTWIRHKFKPQAGQNNAGQSQSGQNALVESSSGQNNQGHNYSRSAGLVLFVFTWAAHAAIWWSIRTRYDVEQSTVKNCTAKDQPAFKERFDQFSVILTAIWTVQMSLFSVFGFGPVVTLWHGRKAATEEDLKATWQYASFFYSMLSITAKVLLAGLLFSYAVQLKDLQDSQWVTPTPTPTPTLTPTPAPGGAITM